MADTPQQPNQEPRWAMQEGQTAVQRHPIPSERKGAGMMDGKPTADARISNDHKSPC